MSTDNKMPTFNSLASFNNYFPQNETQQRAWASLAALAESIVRNQQAILQRDKPAFERGRLIVLQGRPGLGKTHLVEALINYVLWSVPTLRARMYFHRALNPGTAPT